MLNRLTMVHPGKTLRNFQKTRACEYEKIFRAMCTLCIKRFNAHFSRRLRKALRRSAG